MHRCLKPFFYHSGLIIFSFSFFHPLQYSICLLSLCLLVFTFDRNRPARKVTPVDICLLFSFSFVSSSLALSSILFVHHQKVDGHAWSARLTSNFPFGTFGKIADQDANHRRRSNIPSCWLALAQVSQSLIIDKPNT